LNPGLLVPEADAMSIAPRLQGNFLNQLNVRRYGILFLNRFAIRNKSTCSGIEQSICILHLKDIKKIENGAFLQKLFKFLGVGASE
jgi:hypothetical protein